MIENTFMKIIRESIDAVIVAMNDEERTQLVKFCDMLERDNCSWVDYGIRKTIAEMASLKTVDKSKLPIKHSEHWMRRKDVA